MFYFDEYNRWGGIDGAEEISGLITLEDEIGWTWSTGGRTDL